MRGIRLFGAAVATAALTTVAMGGSATADAQAVRTSAAQSLQAKASAPLATDAGRRLAGVRRVDSYWTPERMKHAIALDTLSAKGRPAPTQRARTQPAKPATIVQGSAPAARKAALPPGVKAIRTAARTPLDVSSAGLWPFSYATPSTTTGKVFFHSVSSNRDFQVGDYVCSGSVVNSEAKDLVITAGHCVHGGRGGTWHTNWIFVPDYYYGYEPYGRWYGCQEWSLNGWMNNSDFGYDIGASVLCDSAGRRIANTVGSQGFWANGSRGQFEYAFGYPAQAPFNGLEQRYCTGTTWNTAWIFGGNLGLQCNLNGGSSGGPWLRNFNGSLGYVNGVNSYKSGDPNQIFSPYFGDGALNLYNAVRYLHY